MRVVKHRRAIACVALAAAVLAGGRWARAGLGPENVAVVVNADSAASMAVANEFIGVRKIPGRNVVYLRSKSFSSAVVDVQVFRDRILKPVFEKLASRGLVGQIDCIAYSCDLPYAVRVKGDVGEKELPKTATLVASINGLTFLYQFVMAKEPRYVLSRTNFYARQPGAQADKAAALDAKLAAAMARGTAAMAAGRYAEAEKIFADVLRQAPTSGEVRYHLACAMARQNRAATAMLVLRQAAKDGWRDWAVARADPHLASLRERADFKQLMQQLVASASPARVVGRDTRGFRNSYYWSPTGEAVGPGKGLRYMLSIVLGVAGKNGNSVPEMVASLRRSATADGTRPPGTIYFMANGDVRSRTRQWAFVPAVAALADAGVTARIVKGTLPQRRSDVMGLMAGVAKFDWVASGSTIQPGAICENLTSWGGMMYHPMGQTLLTEFIRRGAAAASGTVTEPFATQSKFPTAFLHYHYARGCTLIEAFYQSIYGPYQLLIVGDPMCRPWAKIPRVAVDGLVAGQELKGRAAVRPRLVAPAPSAGKPQVQPRIARYELFIDERRVGTCLPGGKFDLLAGKLSEGHHELRVVAVSAGLIETRGLLIVPFQTVRHGWRLEVTPSPAKTVPLSGSLELTAKLADATRIDFYHNGRLVARIDGAEGEVSIPYAKLGLGPIRIQPVGIVKSAPVRGRPIETRVVGG